MPAKAAPKPRRPSRRPPIWERPVERVNLLVGTLVALLALPGSAYGIYKLFDQSPTPVRLGVEVEPRPGTNLTWRTDHGMLRAVPGTVPDASAVGFVYTVDLSAQGLSGKSAQLTWSTKDLQGHTLPMKAWVPRAVSVSPSSNDYRTSTQIWVPVPSNTDMWVVVFTLKHGSTQESARSQPESVFESGG